MDEDVITWVDKQAAKCKRSRNYVLAALLQGFPNLTDAEFAQLATQLGAKELVGA